jgi:type IV fimbrial biogenesis protein FimT
MKSPRSAGFSLVELIIVIAILAILATIAVPSLQSFMAQRRLGGAARHVMSDLMNARMAAVSQNRDVQVTFPTSAGASYTYDTGGTALTRNLQTGFGYRDVTVAAAASPTFTSSGRLSGSGCTVILTSTTLGQTKTVTVNSTGRVAIN